MGSSQSSPFTNTNKKRVTTFDISSPTLSYPLGADDISNIVDSVLPNLESFLPDLTKDEKYVLLHKAVLELSKGLTFTNKDDLDTLVKDIVQEVVDELVNTLANNTLNSQPLNAAPSDLEKYVPSGLYCSNGFCISQ